MLIYHPAYDVNHGMFRMLRLLEVNPDHHLRWDAFRILDIYYLFPHLLGSARLPRVLTKQKKVFAAQSSKYARAPMPKVFIQQMAGLHESVVRSLIGKGFIDADAFKIGSLERTDAPLPASMNDAFSNATGDQALVDFLAKSLAAIPAAGTDGLKDRTRLLEHYYDPA